MGFCSDEASPGAATRFRSPPNSVSTAAKGMPCAASAVRPPTLSARPKRPCYGSGSKRSTCCTCIGRRRTSPSRRRSERRRRWSPTARSATVGTDDMRSVNDRFTGTNLDANQAIAATVSQPAAERGVTPAQLALAWVYVQSARLGVPVVPIPGAKRMKWLEQNVSALDVILEADALTRLRPLGDMAHGNRVYSPAR